MKSLIKYSNFILFALAFLILLGLQSHTHISTSLLAILEEGSAKRLIGSFEKTQHAKLLFLTTKGFDPSSLEKIKEYEKRLSSIENIEMQSFKKSQKLYEHKEEYKLFNQELNQSKLRDLDVKKELGELHHEMISSFFLAPIDKTDPFSLFYTPTSHAPLPLKNGHLTLGDYGYFAVFILKSQSLEEHQKLYDEIHAIVDDPETKIFSPLFYFVENSNAIHADVDRIILLAGGILLLLYIFLLKEIRLLLNTLTTLGTSAIISTILLGLIYPEISIFVFVFGISISTIAIDYMFHHYLHGYYHQRLPFNREVLFGFLTTVSAFFILSFTSFLLIQQIAMFALFSLAFSYFQFAFLYPHIGFKPFQVSFKAKLNLKFIQPKILLLFSLLIIFSATTWVKFDNNIRNLDYDNQRLKQLESFFSQKFSSGEKEAFVIQAKEIERLIQYAHKIKKDYPNVTLPLSQLIDPERFQINNAVLKQLDQLRSKLQEEAKNLKFNSDYFRGAYQPKDQHNYTQNAIQSYGIDILSIENNFITYGQINKEAYPALLKYDFVKSISLKEHFEASIEASIIQLIQLGILSLLVILLLLYTITKRAFLYALLFLIFPVALIAIYAYFVALNILHIFMLFIILAIGIDYAIYLSKEQSLLTKQAISYSLISTFAGFGVLIFSHINALFSLGIISTIGIVAIFILLVFVKGERYET